MFPENILFTLCLVLALSAVCHAQNITVGEALPCGDDNLSCIRDPSLPITAVCYNRSILCDGNFFCSFNEDKGNTAPDVFVNALDCNGEFGQAKTFRCNDGSALPLSALCDGYNNCSSGSDETSALCANKCRLPFYGSCSYTHQCVSSELSVNCGACLIGFVEVNQTDCLPLITVGFEATTYDTSEDNPFVEVCASLVSGIITDSFLIEFSASPSSASDGGVDYSFSAVNQTFSESVMRQCAMISITDDELIESPESFTVQLAAFQPNVRLDPQQAIVIIADNDVDIPEESRSRSKSTSSHSRSRSKSHSRKRNRSRSRSRGRSRSRSQRRSQSHSHSRSHGRSESHT